MRITIINRLLGISHGGGETYDLAMATAYGQLGHDVQFVIGRRLFKLDCIIQRVPTTYIRTPYMRWLHYRLESRSSKIFRRLGSYALQLDLDLFERHAFKTIIYPGRLQHTDVFQINGLPRLGSWLREKTGKPVGVVWHGPPSPKARKWSERCSFNVAFGDSLRWVRENADSQAVEVLPGLDRALLERNKSESIRDLYHIPLNGIVVLFVGRMIPIKNLPLLIEAFAQAWRDEPTLHLLLVGDGQERENLEEYVRRLGLETHVTFAGWQERGSLEAYYRSADIFAMTSTYENFPFVVIEAMSCELPVIATRVGGLPKLVEHGETGWLFQDGEVKALKETLLLAARQPELRARLGSKGRLTVKDRYSWLESAKHWLNLFDAKG